MHRRGGGQRALGWFLRSSATTLRAVEGAVSSWVPSLDARAVGHRASLWQHLWGADKVHTPGEGSVPHSGLLLPGPRGQSHRQPVAPATWAGTGSTPPDS